MAGKSTVLFIGSVSTFGLNGEPSPANQSLENVSIEEEAMHIAMTPLAILPTPGLKEGLRGASQGPADPGGRPLGSPFFTALCQVDHYQERQRRPHQHDPEADYRRL